MKPSERIRQIALADAESTQDGRDRLLASWGHPDISIVHVERYLDEEAERAKPKPVICPECTEAGTKSRIVKSHHGGGAINAVYYERKIVFDEDGREHNHDEQHQSHSSGYECSLGHRFSVRRVTPCWCGWTGEKEAT
jgi:hypothetical protein